MKRILLLIFLVALSVRIGLLWYNLDNIGAYGTATLIGESARNLVEGNGYSIDRSLVNNINAEIYKTNKLIDFNDVKSSGEITKFYQLTPGAPALLSLTWLFGDYNYIYLRILQILLDSLGCIVIFFLGKELFSKRVGYIASGIYALYLPIAYLSTVVIHDALMPVIIACSLLFLAKGVNAASLLHFALSALFVGIACYFQPTVIFLVLIFAIALLIIKSRFMYALKASAVMIVVFSTIVTPWIIRNYQVTGVLTPNMRVASWSGFWEGIGEFEHNPIGAKLEDSYAIKVAREELGYEAEFGSPEFDEVFKPKVLDVVTNHTEWFICAILVRMPRTVVYVNHIGMHHTVTPQQYQNADNIFTFALEHPYDSVNYGIIAFFAIVPVILGIIGIVVARKQWRAIILLCTVPFYLEIVHSLTFVSGAGKSLLPGAIAYIVMSAVAVDYFYSKVRHEI